MFDSIIQILGDIEQRCRVWSDFWRLVDRQAPCCACWLNAIVNWSGFSISATDVFLLLYLLWVCLALCLRSLSRLRYLGYFEDNLLNDFQDLFALSTILSVVTRGPIAADVNHPQKLMVPAAFTVAMGVWEALVFWGLSPYIIPWKKLFYQIKESSPTSKMGHSPAC